MNLYRMARVGRGPLAGALAAGWLIACSGCSGAGGRQADTPKAASGPSSADAMTQQMERFSMVGYAEDGSRRWELQGLRASVEGQVVSIRQPDGIGYESPADAQGGPPRVAYLTASFGQINQETRRVRMEDRVTVHTSDGLWLTAPTLYWLPDQNEILTEQPVQLETDRMLLRGRGASGDTELRQAIFRRDIELLLVPESKPGAGGRPAFATGKPPAAAGQSGRPAGTDSRVRITCDGPLWLYYDRKIAVFERRVHVNDSQGDLYSDKLIAYLDEARKTIRYAEALGRVRIVQGGHTARSERAVYDPRTGAVTLLGAPAVRVDRDEKSPAPPPPRPVKKPGRVPGGRAPKPMPSGENLPLQSPRRSP